MTNYRQRHATNSDTMHAWAYASDEERGHNGNDSIHYMGGILLSYNTAIFDRRISPNGGEICLENIGKYSVTTSAHQRLARNAYGGRTIIAGWENAKYGFRLNPLDIEESFKIKLDNELRNLANAKQQRTKDKFQSEIAFVAEQLKLLLEHKVLLKKHLSKSLKDLISKNFDIDKLKDIKEKQLKREENQRLKRLKARSKEYKKEIADFNN